MVIAIDLNNVLPWDEDSFQLGATLATTEGHSFNFEAVIPTDATGQQITDALVDGAKMKLNSEEIEFSTEDTFRVIPSFND